MAGTQFVGRVDPAHGRGKLELCTPDGIPIPGYTFTFEAPSWHLTGRQPIVWDFVAQADEGNWPVIRIAASRSVRLQTNLPRASVLGPHHPLVEIYRLQDESLLPEPDERFEPHRFVGQPYFWAEATDAMAAAELEPLRSFAGTRWAADVPPTGNGAEVRRTHDGVWIRHVGGRWQIKIRAPQDAPAGFAYELHAPQPFGFFVRVIHTANVRIYARELHDIGPDPQITLATAVVASPGLVPVQGASLDPQRLGGRRIEFRDFGPHFHIGMSPQLEARARLLEGLLSVGVGDVYNVAQMAYTVATGRTFWGETVSVEQRCFTGLLLLVSMASWAAGALHMLRPAAQEASEFARLLQQMLRPRTLAEFRLRVDPALLEAIDHLQPAKQARVLQALQRFARGEIELQRVIAIIDSTISEEVLRLIDGRHLRQVLSADRRVFRNPLLAEGYRAYRSRKPHPGTLSLLEWTKATRGRFRAALIAELGEGYVAKINDAIQQRAIPVVTPEALALFDLLGGRAEQFEDLARQTEHVPGFGFLFDKDHLVERRFFESQRVRAVLEHVHSDPAQQFCLLAPKDPGIAAQLPGYSSRYVHTTKTQLLRSLIGNGHEDFYTLQQWWDAHAYTYKALGAERSLWATRLEEVFREIAAATGDEVDYRFTQTLEDFGPQHW